MGFIPSFLRLECGWALVETNDRVRNAAEEHLRLVIVLRFHFPVPRYQFQGVFGNQDTPAKKKARTGNLSLPWRTSSREKDGL